MLSATVILLVSAAYTSTAFTTLSDSKWRTHGARLRLTPLLHSVNRSTDRIMNGQAIDIEKVPWQAHVSPIECGAVIISELFLLTAAHCANESSWVQQVGVGASLRSQSTFYEVETYGNHEDYNEDDISNDIAFLKLKTPLKFSSTVSPISLAEQRPAVGTTTYTSGWGILDLQDFDQPDQLYGLESVIAECGPSHGPDNICTDNPDQPHPTKASTGDSGGPLIAANQLIGITSWSNIESNLSGFADVVYFRSWIKEKTGV